jgi:arylsulfatase
MKKILLPLFLVFSFLGCQNVKNEPPLPNIIFFLADDLGYGETGVYGQQKIETPNIDALAANGIKFTQHYSGAPVCAPARCILLTGKHAGHAYIRGNDEWAERGDVWNYEKACKDPGLEGQRPIPGNTVTIAGLLKNAGYSTAIFGKWGLGAPGTGGVPQKQGFDYFYGYNCQRQAHNYFPPHLWENDKKDTLNNKIISPSTKLDAGADPYDERSYDKFFQQDYAPEKIHEKAIAFMKANRDKPFFIYYASPLPHVPLQAPADWVEKYRNKFGDEEPYLGKHGYFPNRYPRATYAAMIGYLDFQLGDLIKNLKELGIYDNTIIFFTSDNGPTYAGGVDFDFFESSKPFQDGYGRTKGFTYEGGIRIPMIVSWPGHIKPGTQTGHISAFYDIMPTLCDIAQVDPPKDIDGISFEPVLLGEKQKEHRFLYWEFPSYQGQQAVRLGKWKGIRKNIFKGNMEIELYDLENDIKEENNVAEKYPDVVENIKMIMKREHLPAANDRFKIKQLGDSLPAE